MRWVFAEKRVHAGRREAQSIEKSVIASDAWPWVCVARDGHVAALLAMTVNLSASSRAKRGDLGEFRLASDDEAFVLATTPFFSRP